MKKFFKLILLLSLITFAFSDEKFKCKVCNSNENVECAQDPKNSKSVPCEGDEVHCVVYIDKEDQQTVRKCGIKTFCKEKGLTETDCETCTTTECNNKIFPEGRPQCIQCEGDKCADDKHLTSPLPCKKYDKEDKCFVVVKDDKDKSTYRGCVSDSNKVCTENKAFCKTCKNKETTEVCNKDSTETIHCYKCSGEKCQRSKSTESDCKISTDITTTECTMLVGRQACYIFKYQNNVERGCIKDFTETKDGNEKPEKCSDDKCNSKCIKDIKDCLKDDTNKEECPEHTTSCHWCEDQDGNTHRGCGKGNMTISCNYCYGDDCPAKKPNRSCYVCDETDSKCVLGKTASTKQCSKADDDCVVMIKDGNTVRGCASAVLGDKECNEKNLCQRCSKNNCNDKIYPENRLKCYQCSKPEECNDVSKTKKLESLPCLHYVKDDKCFAYSKEGTENMIRGCLSDENSKECKDKNEKCRQCNADNCNNMPFKHESKLKCIQCDKDKQECIWGHNKESAKICKGDIQYWQTETCFTYHHDEKTATRDCTLSESGNKLCKENDDKCEKCKGEACNKKNLASFTCIRCRNDNPGEEKCAETAEGIKSSTCTNSDSIEFENRGCYTERDGEYIIRGCLVDLSPELRKKCTSESYKYCESCKEQDCNKGKPPNNSSANKLSLIFLILGLIVTILK